MLTDQQLQAIADHLNTRPLSAEFALNRYPQDTPALLRDVLDWRRSYTEAQRQSAEQMAEVLKRLQVLPLEDINPDDGPLEIADKVQAFWVDWQRGYWNQKEGARLKRLADRTDRQLQEALRKEIKQQERIELLEKAYADAEHQTVELMEQVRAVTANLAATSQREAQQEQRARDLATELADAKHSHALEMALTRSAQDANEHDWQQRVADVNTLLNQVRLRLMTNAPEQMKEVRNGQTA